MGSAAATTRLGEVLNDAYELHELVSSQGPLEVYRATELRSRTPVRVKVLRPEFALQGAVVERFMRGPRSLSRVTHASLPSVRVDTDDTGIPFIVEEAVKGRPLAALLESFPQGLPLGLATHLFLPLCEALALAHAQKVLHGALEPARIVLLGTDNAPVPKVLQLGVAREDLGPADAAYRAPELAADAPATAQGDVFALGVLLYRMLSGELPFRTGKGYPEPLDEIAPQLPPTWVDLTADCLEVDPARRLRDVIMLLERVRECVGARVTAPVQLTAPVRAAASAPVQVPKASSPASEQAHPVTDRAPASSAKVADPVALEDTAPDFGVEPSAEAAKPRSIAMRTISAVAAAFGPLTEQTVVDDATSDDKPGEATAPKKKEEAKAAAEKLGSKMKGETARKEPKGDDAPRKDAKVNEPSRKDAKVTEASRKPAKGDDAGRPAAQEALLGGVHKAKDDPKSANGSDRAKDDLKSANGSDKAGPVAAKGKVAARPAGKNQPTQGQIAAVALTDAQLNALRGMRSDDKESRDRWILLLLMLLFMLALGFGVPLVYEPDMVAAHAMFGPKLRMVAGGFAVVVVIAAVRLWAAQVQGGTIIVRVTSYAMMVVTGCILVLTSSLFSRSPTLGMMLGGARAALPLATSFLFFMFAFGAAMRGISNLASNIGYGLIVMMMSTGSMYASYHAIFATVLKGHKRGQHMAVAGAGAGAGTNPNGPPGLGVNTHMTPEQIKAQLTDKTSMTDWQEKHQDINTMTQRKEVGANEEDDLKSATELNDTRAKNQKTLENLQANMPQLPGAVNGGEPPPSAPP